MQQPPCMENVDHPGGRWVRQGGALLLSSLAESLRPAEEKGACSRDWVLEGPLCMGVFCVAPNCSAKRRTPPGGVDDEGVPYLHEYAFRHNRRGNPHADGHAKGSTIIEHTAFATPPGPDGQRPSGESA
jgi:hypothetical protein